MSSTETYLLYFYIYLYQLLQLLNISCMVAQRTLHIIVKNPSLVPCSPAPSVPGTFTFACLKKRPTKPCFSTLAINKMDPLDRQGPNRTSSLSTKVTITMNKAHRRGEPWKKVPALVQLLKIPSVSCYSLWHIQSFAYRCEMNSVT